MAEHHGSCHCGAVAFDVDIALDRLITCNCSICGRTGSILAFIPATQFTLRSGEDHLTDYQFGPQRIHHLFCKVCGVRAFARGAARDGTATVAVNVRCLEGVDVHTLTADKFDGKSL